MRRMRISIGPLFPTGNLAPLSGRVALRGLPLGAPTDPDVQNSRIRLLKSQICCSIRWADAPWLRKRVALQQHVERRPDLAPSLKVGIPSGRVPGIITPGSGSFERIQKESLHQLER